MGSLTSVDSLSIAAGAFGTVSISVLVMLMVDLVKAYWPGRKLVNWSVPTR